MIDHIGGKHISIRRSDGEVVIRLLDRSATEYRFTADEWFELTKLLVAIKAAVDFDAEYGPG